MTQASKPRTLAEKLWDAHTVVKGENGEPDLIYIDLHLIHEVTSPQAFDGLRMADRPLRRVDLMIATEDHNTPTLNITREIEDPTSRLQIETLRRNVEEFGVRAHPLGDGVAVLARGVHDVVELEVQVAEPAARDVPVGLLALDVQVDERDEHALQVGAERLRRLESGGGAVDRGCGHGAPRSLGGLPERAAVTRLPSVPSSWLVLLNDSRLGRIPRSRQQGQACLTCGDTGRRCPSRGCASRSLAR